MPSFVGKSSPKTSKTLFESFAACKVKVIRDVTPSPFWPIGYFSCAPATLKYLKIE